MARTSWPDFQMNYDTHSNMGVHDTLFIHGNLASNRWWEPSFKIWKAQANKSSTGRFICAEWRGCGKSSGPQSVEEFQPHLLAKDYVHLAKELGLQNVRIVAHSAGGLIGLLALQQAPEIFKAAVLLDPVFPGGVPFPEERLEAFRRLPDSREFCGQVMAATIHGVDQQSTFFQELLDDAFTAHPLVYSGVPSTLKNINYLHLLAEIKQPILILHGEHDWVLPVEASQRLADLLPNARFELIHEHGHSLNVEDPKLFVSLVDRFLFSHTSAN